MLEIKDDLDTCWQQRIQSLAKRQAKRYIVVQLGVIHGSVICKMPHRSMMNPIPNFTKLKEECTSGFLTMPAIGAGTANSEFEVLTGFDVAYFGAGEYPYKTVLGKHDL